MISIDQLLESVDLDFEPRWVTKNLEGCIWIWNTKPKMYYESFWDTETENDDEYYIGNINLSEFYGKDWTECIYEVPRKTTVNEVEQKMLAELERKLNAIVDAAIEAVNELKGAKNE